MHKLFDSLSGRISGIRNTYFGHFLTTHSIITSALMIALLSGCRSEPKTAEPWPWTPEVEEFVRVYMETGGQRLTDWMGDDEILKPEESLGKFEVMEGLEMDLVSSEPCIRQPVDMHFDARGRLWVVQYLQYPFPAGVTINFYDQWLRAEYTGVPDPPPGHVPGADKITVLEDTNGDGKFDSCEDVITGLNITTSVLTGKDGVWVMNPPYLLFYPDHDGDGFPDGDPEVHLEGFGLEDTHSLANALTHGPDGWIYGVHGSTSTSNVKGISFLGQTAWRYHPENEIFELFSQGGGNPWTLDFDSKGRAFTGTNTGGARGLHWVQGGRYVKNWPKHGPLTEPWSFGYFPHMDHEGDKTRFSMTFVVYEEGKMPAYEGQLLSGMALTNRMQASRFEKDGSTFRTIDTDSIVNTSDRGFRPVDMKVGPDGAIYIADWCDIRLSHTQPVDTWNKSCGRIWRLRAKDYQPAAPFNLAELSNVELIDQLTDEQKWYRNQARRILGERGDRAIVPQLRKMTESQTGQSALEALWAVHLIEGMDNEWAMSLLDHPDAYVRYWTIRFLGDNGEITPEIRRRLTELARSEPNPEVRSQLASTARRLPAEDALPILFTMMNRAEDVNDKHIPLLIWWALDDKIDTDADAVISHLDSPDVWNAPIFNEHISQRIARRFASERGDNPSYSRISRHENWMIYAQYPRTRLPDRKGDFTEWETNYTPQISDRNLGYLAALIDKAPRQDHVDQILEGIDEGLAQGPPVEQAPEDLMAKIDRLWNQPYPSNTLVSVAAQLNHPGADKVALELAMDQDTDEAERNRLAELVSAGQGEQWYIAHCAACHQVDGRGLDRMAPALQNSDLVLGREEELIHVVLHGRRGELVMPAMDGLEDEEIAAILTYIRSTWGHSAGPVAPEAVSKVRSLSDSSLSTPDRTIISK